jgi:hypothetical protein
MDGPQFDDLLRALSRSRRSLAGTALAASGVIAGLSSTDAKKKKKKKCAKKCPIGCCTSKTGKCIQPAQQSATQCGTGGEICRNTNCGGGGEQCAATCDGCCTGNTCVMTDSQTECGRNGVDCFACDDNQECAGTHCCGKLGHECAGDGECCLTLGCEDNACCATFSTCTQDADCCQLGSDVICDGGECRVKTGASCQPGWMCQGDLPCPGSGICEQCAEGQIVCGNAGCCPSGNCCEHSGTCCTFQCCLSGDPVHAYCCETENCCT